jgi:signal transduction histidine kinase
MGTRIHNAAARAAASFGRLSIKSKIVAVVLAISLALLLLLSTAFSFMNRYILRHSLVTEVAILAEVIAANSTAALEFGNAADASEVLSALRAESSIRLACTYDADGRLLGHYFREDAGESVPDSVSATDEERFADGYLHVLRQVFLNGRRVGQVYVLSDTRRVEYGLRTVISSTILLSIVAFLLAFLLASQLHVVITRPLSRLVDVMQEVSRNRNYDVRVPRTSGDEVGVLVDEFNSMLGQIQQRDQELESKVEELNRSNAELDNFAYIAAHDLQEPLRAVSSYVQLLKRQLAGKLDADATENIEFAVNGAARMQKLIQDLLAYSRVGKERKPFHPVNGNALMAAVVKNLAQTVKESSARVTWDELPVVMGDETQLIQLLQNLVSNAIKFRKRDEAPAVHVSAAEEDGHWRFKVADNGIGIEAQYHQRIFVIFQRLHARSAYPGTGIGLAICKKIVERHGGEIDVNSTPGQGSVFTFTIPRTGAST